jgi:hypothetical protein
MYDKPVIACSNSVIDRFLLGFCSPCWQSRQCRLWELSAWGAMCFAINMIINLSLSIGKWSCCFTFRLATPVIMQHVAHTSHGRTYCLLAPLFHKVLIWRLLWKKWVKGKHNISCLDDIVSSKFSKNLPPWMIDIKYPWTQSVSIKIWSNNLGFSIPTEVVNLVAIFSTIVSCSSYMN